MSNAEMGAPVLLFGPSRLVRELRAFCVPELLSQWIRAAQQAAAFAAAADAIVSQRLPPPPPPLAVHPMPGGLLAQLGPLPPEEEHVLTAAAQRCTLLTAALRPLAAAATIEAAAAAALERLPAGTAQLHSLRTLCLDRTSARAPAERAMQQQLQQLGLGSTPDPAVPRLWCIQHTAGWPLGSTAEQQPQEAQSSFLLALQLAAGASLSAAATSRQLGPTAMLPELAALSCSLAAVQLGSTVLDPFCGSGSLLAAAADAGAALAVGSDIDATHFAGSGSSSGDGSRGSSQPQNSDSQAAPVLLQADIAGLQQLLPPAVADAIITDLPYGYRTDVAVDAAAASAADEAAAAGSTAVGEVAAAAAQEAEGWQHLLAVLLQLASHVLVPSGRLVAWMPLQQDGSSSDSRPSSAALQAGGAAASSFKETATVRQQQQLEKQGRQHGLQLLHLLPESRQGGYPRAAAVFEVQGSGSGSANGSGSGTVASASHPAARRQQMLAALEAVAAAGSPVLNLRSAQRDEQPVDMQQADGGDFAAACPGKGAAGAQDGPSPAAVEQRGLHYKHVRGAAKGAAIDVWR